MKTFICDECSRDFPTPSDLERHHRIHLPYKNRKFGCPEGCGSRFNQLNQVTAHVDAIHKKLRVVCPEKGCIKSFSDKGNLTRHRQRDHGLPTRAQKRGRARHPVVNVRSSRLHARHTDNETQFPHKHDSRSSSMVEDQFQEGEEHDEGPPAPLVLYRRRPIILGYLPKYTPRPHPYFPRIDPQALFGKSSTTFSPHV